MTAPEYAVTTDDGRTYTNPLKGEHSPQYISVTTAIKNGIPKHLVPWAKKITAEYAVDNVAQWSQLDRSAAVDLIKREADRKRDDGGLRGTLAHDALEGIARGGAMPNLDFMPTARAYIEAGVAFLRDFTPRFELIEVTVYNDEFGYAGSLDFIAELPGMGLVLGDYKTAKDIYHEIGAQLAAYRFAEYGVIKGPDGRPQRIEIPPVVGGVAVHLRGDGTYAVRPVRCDRAEHEVFLSALAIARWTAGPAKGVVLPAASVPPAQGGEWRAWLQRRILALPDMVKLALSVVWPTGVPGLKSDHDHSGAELDLIEERLNAVEAEHSIPFGETPSIRVQAEKLIYQLELLPTDLLLEVEATAKGAGIPNLRTREVTVDHLNEVRRLCALALETWSQRAKAFQATAQEFDNDALVEAALSLVGCVDPQRITEAQLDRLAEVLGAYNSGLVAGVMGDAGAISLVVAPGSADRLLASVGSKSQGNALARQIAGRLGVAAPKSWADVADDPLIASALAAAIAPASSAA